MQINQSNEGAIVIIAPVGRIDTTTSPALEDAVRSTLDDGARALVVDLAGSDYISSAGLRVLLVLAKRMRERSGSVVLCGLNQPVRQVFQLAGFLPLFTIDPSRDAAVARLTSSP
jgi:anti-anti-sigma factor